MNRRDFLRLGGIGLGGLCASAGAYAKKSATRVMTVRGAIPAKQLGRTLIHEHVLVDFIGADKIAPGRYDPDEIFRTALPFLTKLKAAGGDTLVECTPAYLGRDAGLLRRLSEASGLHIVTNTGFYGAAKDKYVPAFAYAETPPTRWRVST